MGDMKKCVKFLLLLMVLFISKTSYSEVWRHSVEVAVGDRLGINLHQLGANTYKYLLIFKGGSLNISTELGVVQMYVIDVIEPEDEGEYHFYVRENGVVTDELIVTVTIRRIRPYAASFIRPIVCSSLECFMLKPNEFFLS